MSSVLKPFVKPYKKWRDKRKSSREGSIASVSSREVNVSTPDHNIKSPTTEPEREDAAVHMKQYQDQTLPAITISEPPPKQEASIQQHCSSLPDPAPSNVALFQPEIAKAPITPAESIWNSAYDKLKAEEPKLVQEYEKVLSLKLSRETASLDLASEGNPIEKENVSVRRAQMHQLICDGLDKTMREASIKDSIGTVMQVVNTTKRLVGDAIKDIPQAALPWAIVYASLEILINPISQTEANHKGVEYIGITIKWYWEQATHLFVDSQEDHAFIGVQHELQTAFIDFYKKLLQFQMKSICNYYRHRGFVFLRDLVKLDDWDGSFDSIREDDASLRKKVHAFLSLESESHLKVIARHTKAQERYQRTQEDQQCLRDLRITDPRTDKSRIENTKGGLLQESYRWILENPEFQAWRNNDDNRLLWLRGDPGKGKTMLLCGLVQELMQQSAPSLVTFFFCQATIPTINNHIAVLRGLIWLLADQQPSLISYIRKLYDTAGKSLFDEGNAWYTLSEIFNNMLCDKELPPIYIVIDALDECTTGLTELLHLIQNLSTSPNVKWVVSSRNWLEIEERLIEEMNLSLEVNAALVKTAVDAYISYKASQISLLKQDDQLKEEVCRQMREKANGTFLWVAIVFERLNSKRYAYYKDMLEVLEILDEMPKDLTELYAVMLKRTSQLEGKGPELCRTILAVATLAYQPLHLNELSTLAGFQDNLKNLAQLKDLIKDCGSFLTVRENNIYFIHQSAKEYLASDLSSQSVIFPNGVERITYDMISNSLDVMGHALRENIYGLEHPGILIDDVSPPNPNPLDHILYSCTYWVAHLCEISTSRDDQSLRSGLIDDEKILGFLKKHFLHWLEALSLTRNLSSNTGHIKHFNGLLKQHSEKDELREFIYDASRFMQYHAHIMGSTPMQIYSSALLFSPTESLVRSYFNGQLSSWIISKPVMESHWSPSLQIIEAKRPVAVDSSGVNLLILNAYDKNVEIWDMTSGKRVQVLNHAESVHQAVFSSDSKHVRTVTSSQILSWDVNSGAMIQEIGGDIDWKSASVSNNGKFVASYTNHDTLQICDVVEGMKLQISEVDSHFSKEPLKLEALRLFEKRTLKWSNNSRFLAHEGRDMRIWDVTAGIEKKAISWEFRGTVNFSSDSKFVVFNDLNGLTIWDLDREQEILTLGAELSMEFRYSMFGEGEFSKDSRLIAASCHHHRRHEGYPDQDVVYVWDIATGQKQHDLRWGSREIKGLAWSDDAKTLAVAFEENVEICDLTEHTHRDANINNKHLPCKIIYSADFKLVAVSREYTEIWDTTTGSEIQTLGKYNRLGFHKLRFSQDSKLIYACTNKGFRAWDIASGSVIPKSTPPAERFGPTVLSFDGRLFASMPTGRDEIQLWNLTKDEAISHSITCRERSCVISLEFSNNAEYIVSLCLDHIFEIWNVATGKRLWVVEHDISAHRGIGIRCETCDYQGLPRTSELLSLAISNDGSIVLATEAFFHGMWILTKENKKIRLQICCQYFVPCFDIESPYILTQFGRINLDSLIAQAENFIGHETVYDYQLLTEGYGISSDGSWITWNGKNVLWLPPDYRTATERAISRHCIVMGTSTGRISIISFSGPPLVYFPHFWTLH